MRPKARQTRSSPPRPQRQKACAASEAIHLRIAEQYIKEFGALAKSGTSMIVPANAADISSMIASAMDVMKVIDPPPTGF